MNKQSLGYLGLLSLLAPLGVYLSVVKQNNSYLAFLGFLGFLGFFTYFSTDLNKKWKDYTPKERWGTIVMFLFAVILIIGTLMFVLFATK